MREQLPWLSSLTLLVLGAWVALLLPFHGTVIALTALALLPPVRAAWDSRMPARLRTLSGSRLVWAPALLMLAWALALLWRTYAPVGGEDPPVTPATEPVALVEDRCRLARVHTATTLECAGGRLLSLAHLTAPPREMGDATRRATGGVAAIADPGSTLTVQLLEDERALVLTPSGELLNALIAEHGLAAFDGHGRTPSATRVRAAAGRAFRARRGLWAHPTGRTWLLAVLDMTSPAAPLER